MHRHGHPSRAAVVQSHIGIAVVRWGQHPDDGEIHRLFAVQVQGDDLSDGIPIAKKLLRQPVGDDQNAAGAQQIRLHEEVSLS